MCEKERLRVGQETCIGPFERKGMIYIERGGHSKQKAVFSKALEDATLSRMDKKFLKQ